MTSLYAARHRSCSGWRAGGTYARPQHRCAERAGCGDRVRRVPCDDIRRSAADDSTAADTTAITAHGATTTADGATASADRATTGDYGAAANHRSTDRGTAAAIRSSTTTANSATPRSVRTQSAGRHHGADARHAGADDDGRRHRTADECDAAEGGVLARRRQHRGAAPRSHPAAARRG